MADVQTPVPCSSCGADNASGTLNCSDCGARLPEIVPGSVEAVEGTEPGGPRHRYHGDKPLMVGGCTAIALALFGIGLAAAIFVPNRHPAKAASREKACYANMRILMGAIEMYNMDHAAMIGFLNQPAPIKVLHSQQYLKSPPVCADQGPNTTYRMLSSTIPVGAMASDGFGLDVDVPVTTRPPQAEADPNMASGSGSSAATFVDGTIECPIHGTVE